MKDLNYERTKLANIALEFLIKYKDVSVSLAKESSEQPEIDIREIMDMYGDRRNEIYKLAGWLYHD